jgi:Holliday junction resolvase-like predicted endonuclease
MLHQNSQRFNRELYKFSETIVFLIILYQTSNDVTIDDVIVILDVKYVTHKNYVKINNDVTHKKDVKINNDVTHKYYVNINNDVKTNNDVTIIKVKNDATRNQNFLANSQLKKIVLKHFYNI